MATINELNLYSQITERLFGYMNGKVNTLNKNCTLRVEVYDLIGNAKGDIHYPNDVCIYVGTIIDSWKDDWLHIVNKHDFICMLIAWAICHELHHADQLIQMVQYRTNPVYKAAIETDVETASHVWCTTHANRLGKIGGFNCDMSKIKSNSLSAHDASYTKAGVKQFYLQTIANIILRDIDIFKTIRPLIDDDYAKTIVLAFAPGVNVTIKSNGKYIKENIPIFSSLTFQYMGYYDSYTIVVEEYRYVDVEDAVMLKFVVSNPRLHPMIFRQN